MDWRLNNDSLNEKLSDLAEEEIAGRYPEETKGMIAISSDINLFGDPKEWDHLLFEVTIFF